MDQLFFYSWSALAKILVSAPLLYAAIIAMVRLSGKRSTSQMNNFDWIVTVAIGSLLASGIVVEDVTLIEALLAIGLLMGMQYAVTRAVLRNGLVRRLVKAQPTLLMRDGEFLHDNMRAERITEGEVRAAIRGHGLAATSQVGAVVLETDARMSVIPQSKSEDDDCLADIVGDGRLESV